MKAPWRWSWVMRAHGLVPHAPLERAFGVFMRARLPRPILGAVIAAWVARGGIALADFEVRDWDTLEDFFLRRLRAGARPIGEGLVSPVDGVVVAVGASDGMGEGVGEGVGPSLVIKGHAVSLEALLGGPARLAGLVSGPLWQITIFLTPDGYHHVHAPCDLTLVEVVYIAGRAFPQNDDALALRPDVHVRNARAVLWCETAAGPMALVMVAASLVSGIQVEGPGPYRKGDRIGAFSFGSTVVLVASRATRLGLDLDPRPRDPDPGERLQMGEALGRGGRC